MNGCWNMPMTRPDLLTFDRLLRSQNPRTTGRESRSRLTELVRRSRRSTTLATEPAFAGTVAVEETTIGPHSSVIRRPGYFVTERPPPPFGLKARYRRVHPLAPGPRFGDIGSQEVS
jgi:hypothetical protein